MTTTTAKTALEGLVDNCRKAWAAALTRTLGAVCEVQVVREAASLPDSMPICVVLNAEGAISGQAAIVLDQRNMTMLAAKIGGNSGQAGVQELLRQAIVLGINEFQKQFGPTRAQLTAGAAPGWAPNSVLTFLAGNAGTEALRAHLLLSPQIEGVSAPVPIDSSAPLLPAISPRDLPAQNMHLVMGVQLEVTLRFGQKRLPLKQLVELNAGAVVELDKRVHEPVDLLLRDKVFARGEVVIVEGHYGLRITEVCSQPQESM